MTGRLRLRPVTILHWRRWGSDYVVFDGASGRTHQLDALTAGALLAIEESPKSLAVLAEQLSAELSLDRDALVATLPGIVEQLTLVGLIETTSE